MSSPYRSSEQLGFNRDHAYIDHYIPLTQCFVLRRATTSKKVTPNETSPVVAGVTGVVLHTGTSCRRRNVSLVCFKLVRNFAKVHIEQYESSNLSTHDARASPKGECEMRVQQDIPWTCASFVIYA